jgi:hypothetical protein
VVFERQGDRYAATVEGGPPKEPEDIKAIEELTKSANANTFGEAMLPKEAVAVGGTWTVPGKVVLANVPEFKNTDPAAVKAQGKLLRVYKKDGQQWGTVEITIDVPVRDLAEALVVDKPLSLQIKGTLDTAIDGSSTAGTVVATVTLKGTTEFTENNMTFTLDLAMHGEFRKQRNAEK